MDLDALGEQLEQRKTELEEGGLLEAAAAQGRGAGGTDRASSGRHR
jgi:hypothetical protein